jgi:hypothetical protein
MDHYKRPEKLFEHAGGYSRKQMRSEIARALP